MKKHMTKLVGFPMGMQGYADTRIMAPYKEQEVFCNKYVKTMRLKVDSEGKFVIEIPKY